MLTLLPSGAKLRGLRSISGIALLPFDLGNTEESAVSKILTPEDYPETFRGLKEGTVFNAHPDDYKLDSHPIKVNVFIYKPSRRQRLSYVNPRKSRITSSRRPPSCVIQVSQCRCRSPTLCADGLAVAILMSDSADYIKTIMMGRSNNLNGLPKVHQPANIAGLPLFFLLDVHFKHASVSELQYDGEDVSHFACDLQPTFKHF